VTRFAITVSATVSTRDDASRLARELDASAGSADDHGFRLTDELGEDGEPTSRVSISLRVAITTPGARDAEAAVEQLLQLAADRAGVRIVLEETVALHAESDQPIDSSS
jgi:hypothetical protein